MEYLHQHGMLHRDLNSKNCLLRKEGSKYTAVVADFGLAAREPHLLRYVCVGGWVGVGGSVGGCGCVQCSKQLLNEQYLLLFFC